MALGTTFALPAASADAHIDADLNTLHPPLTRVLESSGGPLRCAANANGGQTINATNRTMHTSRRR